MNSHFITKIKRYVQREGVIKFIRFGTVGTVGYIVNAVLIAILPFIIGIEPLIWALATEVSIISNFTLNNLWTFGSQRIIGRKHLINKFLQFNATSAGALIIITFFGTLGVSMFGEEYRQIILPVIIVVAVVPYNWYMYRRYIWRMG